MWLLAGLACTSASDKGQDDSGGPSLTVMTFNTGTTQGLAHDGPPDDGYTSEHADLSDAWYGDGLAWVPAVDATRAMLADLQPDLVVFQEMFWAPDCADIPAEAHPDFFCDGWSEGDATVVTQVLGPDYQVACHLDKPDKCAAVRSEVGRFEGCDSELCANGLDGARVPDCGGGSRVGRGQVLDPDGQPLLTLVSVHGTSGLGQSDQDCRVAQVEQVFVDLGDGQPGVNGALNLVMGDLNTDPHRFLQGDRSAGRWADFVGSERDFSWHSAVGPDAPASYGGLADIDHVASDGLTGNCVHLGLDSQPVIDAVYFDHLPLVCELRLPPG